jgi:hypothetical protein
VVFVGSPSLLWLALVLALAGTLLNGLGALWQNTAVKADTGSQLLRWDVLLRLLRDRGWLLGQSAVVVGSLLHFAALAFAPVTVVQPIGVLAVAVTAVASARTRRTKLGYRSGLALLAVIVGVGGFTALAATNATVTKVSDATAVLIALIILGILATLGFIGAMGHGWVRCVAFAAAGGAMFAFTSVVIRLGALSVQHKDYASFPIGLLIGAVLSIPAVIWLIQQAHASGPPDVVVAALTLADPMVAVGIGYIALGEGARTYTAATLGEVLFFTLAAIGIVALSKFRKAAGDRSDVLAHTTNGTKPTEANQAGATEEQSAAPQRPF